MRIKQELDTLKSKDIYSLMLFALFKLRDIPEYSSLSELAYVLDKNNLLKFCEYFGGLTLKVPTINELESMLYSLVLYQYVDIEKLPYAEAIKLIGKKGQVLRQIKSDYLKMKDLLDTYEFKTRVN